jgi:hypothetical protein
MSIALPIFLLICGLISFWLLADSKVSWLFKIPAITIFCAFTIVFFLSIASFLGWSALEKDLPEKVSIHWVVIKEPSIFTHTKGRIYLLLESHRSPTENRFLNMFGYASQKNEPRLFSVPYSRQLHEELEKSVIPRLKAGQIVDGSFKKKAGKGKEGSGKGKDGGKEGKGGGSESQEQEYQYYNLPPSEIQHK